ncbi:hypothetical protein [Mycobacteroides sp. LB1]|uniref:hypothetical protein n=1 Tax=Mycobacteroides sp. LB1 TaxID=2750814 RepID=UPI0015DDC2A9|nr:hypothetical protein [Mycobacteroides sp. LB1]
MNVNDLVKRILNRRIALVLVALMVCSAGAYGYTKGVTIRASTASAVVVPPPTFSSTGDTLGANPMLNLSPQMAQLVGILATSISSQPAQTSIAAAAPGVDYTVSNSIDLGPNNQQPSSQLSILVLCGETSDCKAGAGAVLDVARDNLVKLQVGASVAPENWATLTILQEPTAPVVMSNSAVKSAGSMAVAALLAATILLLAYDALAMRRRKERRADRQPGNKVKAKTETPRVANEPSAAAEAPTDPVEADAGGNGQILAKNSATNGRQASGTADAPTIVDDDLDNLEIDDEALAQAVLNWTPPRLTDFRTWPGDKPSPDR